MVAHSGQSLTRTECPPVEGIVELVVRWIVLLRRGQRLIGDFRGRVRLVGLRVLRHIGLR